MGFFSKTPKVSTDQKLIDELLARGVSSVIPKELALKKLRSGEPLRVYLGIDPTGAKLHLGHSVVLRKLKAFADAGHHVIFVVGSFTAMIGDPTDRDAARAPLSKADVEQNFHTYKKQAEKILNFSKVEIRYNHEWLAPLTLSEIVKLAGTFTVQQMLQRDMFEKRMQEGKPIGLHEFLYPLMVGYDSVVLDVDAEMGGSDQEFNMLAGRHLQHALHKRDKFVLTTKLIEGTDGRKMSKTYNNCVYLEDSPGEMFGKIMSINDGLVKTYFECTTDVRMEVIDAMTQFRPRDAKETLAREIVKMYHGKEAAEKAAGDWINTYSKGGVPEHVLKIAVSGDIKVSDELVKLKVVESKSELRRLQDQGAVSSVLSGQKITNIDEAKPNETIRIGKHRFIEIENK